MQRPLNLLASFSVAAAVACGGPQKTPTESIPPVPTEVAGWLNDPTEYPQIAVKYDKFVLDNGLTVLVHEDRKAPVVAVNVWYHVGSKDERVGKTGFAHLFEHLMFQGSENFKGEFFEPLEKAGATDMNGTTNEDRTNYFQTVPTPALDLALWMESDRMGHFAGAISQERLDEQRGVVQNEKRQGQNRPYGKAWEVIPENTYPAGHPYSWSVIGSMEDLNAASLDDVKGWFAEYYGASNAVLVLAGDISVAEAKAKVQKYFGHIPPGPATPKRGPWVAKMTERKELTLFDRVPQERVYRVYNLPPYGSAEFEHLRVGGLILAEGKNSRLYKRLVYDEQLATNVFFYLGEGEIGSQAYFIADARPGVDLAKVETAMDQEFARLAAEPPTMDEVSRVKMSMFAEIVRGLEKVGGFGGKTDLLAQHEVFFGDASRHESILESLRKAGPLAVQNAAASWFGHNAFVLRVLPEATRTTATAQADRKAPPSPGDAPNLDLPPLQRAKLSNGVEVLLAERHETPMVHVTAMFDIGFAYDQGGKLGTTRFAMDVLDEGTQTDSALEFAAKLERLGATVQTSASLDEASVGLTTLTTTLDGSLDLFASVLTQPAFAETEIERVRNQTLAAIDQETSNPFSSALRTLGPIMYPAGHPYALPLTGSGTKESVASLNREDLVEFHRAVLRPERATILVVGDTDLPTITTALEARLAGWKADGAAAQPPKGTAPVAPGVTVYLIDKPRAEQSLIIAGNLIGPRNNDTYLALDAMNAILGGTFMARINMNLREDKHWSYGARSFVLQNELDQLFGAYAQVQTDKTAESMAEILKELTEIRTSRPASADELERTKENKTRKLPGSNETGARLLSSVAEIVRYGLPDDYWDTFSDKVRGLTLQDVQKAANDNVKPQQLTWIVVGDLSRIEEKVRALGYGKVTVLDAQGKPVQSK